MTDYASRVVSGFPTTQGGAAPASPVAPSRGPRRGAFGAEVSFDASGFWGSRQRVNATATLEHCLDWMERLGWIENFDRVARGEVTYDRPGWQFSDSELYKLMEAMAWEYGRTHDSVIDRMFCDLTSRVSAAQDADGYIGTAFGHSGLPPRYSDLSMGHELYNMGHLLQAGVARLRTVGDDELVDVARRAADHICHEFGPDGRQGICGHPEIEVALAEFGRATGERTYIDQAQLFIERRGHGTLPVRPLLSAAYFQDDVPVRDADALRGHAVRALYLSAGAVDVAVENSDGDLLASLERQWERTVARRTYITGGMGSRHQDEGFGDDWELPADRAYCETCAGVASVMFSWRLYLATGKVQYIDLIERTLFNILATAVRADGRAFFYANPLQQRETGDAAELDGPNLRAEGSIRAPWFDVSCCPTNVARTLASLHMYAISVEDDVVSLLQYASGEVEVELGEEKLAFNVVTRYPDDGTVRIEVSEAPDREVTLRLRVPSWADKAKLEVAGQRAVRLESGWFDVQRRFSTGDVLVLDLCARPRLTWPDPRIDALRGTVAIENGPLVLCIESTDLPDGVALEDVRITADAPIEMDADDVVVRAVAVAEPAGPTTGPGALSQRPTTSPQLEFTLRAAPYHQWAERQPSTMRVFVPTGEHEAAPR